MKTILFIPAYNAEKTIVKVLERIPSSVMDEVEEVLIQDNASGDKTSEVASAYKIEKKLDKVTVVRNEKNLHYGGTKKKAFRYAIDKGYDIFVMVHADGQYPPEQIPAMIGPIKSGEADLVIGSRTNEREGGMALWKLMGNKLLTFVENIFLGMSLHEFHSGYKAYNLHSLAKIPFALCSNDHAISSETIIQFRLKGMKIKEVLMPTSYDGDYSQCSVGTSFRYGFDVMVMLLMYVGVKLGMGRPKKFALAKKKVEA